MIYTIDFEHIFFDRYNLTEEEKQNEAMKILAGVFKTAEIKDLTIEINAEDAYEEKEAASKLLMLKKEFFLILKPYEEPSGEEEKPDLKDEMEKYIRTRYLYEEFCPDKLCERFNISRKAADNFFKRSFSESVSEYIKRVRVEKATELIKTGEKMEEVAYLCGFGSIKTMQRAFKSLTGKTPGEYRAPLLDSKGTK